MAKLMRNAKAISYLIASFAFLAVGILIFPPVAWCECTSCGDCPRPLINYTTQQMSYGGTQELNAVGGAGSYTWSIVSGGGSLSSSSGPSTVYTAPADNENCANNPTILLTDACQKTASARFAISGPQYTTAYRVSTWIDEPVCTPLSSGWFLVIQAYDCDGSRHSVGDFGCFLCSDFPGSNCFYPTCASEAGAIAACQSCPPHLVCGDFWIHCPEICTDGLTWDVRNDYYKFYGCCPAAFLTQPCNASTFSVDSTSFNPAGGGKINFTGDLSAIPGASWTLNVAGRSINGSGSSISWDGKDSSGKL